MCNEHGCYVGRWERQDWGEGGLARRGLLMLCGVP